MRPNANNLHDQVHAALGNIPDQKMLQLSMDGHNTNWRVFDILNSFRGESCGLHAIHGAFQTRVKAAKWDIEKLFWPDSNA